MEFFTGNRMAFTAEGATEKVTAEIQGSGTERFIRLKNHSNAPVAVREVLIGTLRADPQTAFFGEGYNMLSMYAGSLAEPYLAGSYEDDAHYHMPQTPGRFTVYNLLCLHMPDECVLMAFTSCRRFRGEFRIAPDGEIQAVLCCEDVAILAGATVELEELAVYREKTAADAYARFAKRTAENGCGFYRLCLKSGRRDGYPVCVPGAACRYPYHGSRERSDSCALPRQPPDDAFVWSCLPVGGI